MPDSHQEDNARIFKEKNAVIVLNQKKLTSKDFLFNIEKILNSEDLRKELGENIKKVIKIGNDDLLGVIEKLIKIKK